MRDPANASVIAEFVSELQERSLPADVMTMARQSLIDWFAACLASATNAEGRIISDEVQSWNSQGNAIGIDGCLGSAAPIALINGTYSHASEYDDFHIDAILHVGGPTFAAALAVATDRGLTGEQVLRAFVAGFEVTTRLSMNGTGLSICNAGWHATCVLGHVSAAIACASLMRLDQTQIMQAIGFAAAQASGLQSSSGTIAKPLQIGKAAFAGVMAAGLAGKGAKAPQHFLEGPDGLFSILCHKPITPAVERLGREWEVLRNTFKPYSACQLTHAVIDAARAIHLRLDATAIHSVQLSVNPFAVKIAGTERPATPLQCRFSLKHVCAMALLGYQASPRDFGPERVDDPEIVNLRERIEVVATDAVSRTGARLEIVTTDNQVTIEEVLSALGSLERPMTMADTERKFLESASDPLGRRAGSMLDALKNIQERSALSEVSALLREGRLSR